MENMFDTVSTCCHTLMWLQRFNGSVVVQFHAGRFNDLPEHVWRADNKCVQIQMSLILKASLPKSQISHADIFDFIYITKSVFHFKNVLFQLFNFRNAVQNVFLI